MNIQHSSRSDQWFTPPEYIAAVREVLGGKIDLDPASCVAANRLVGAHTYFNEQDDGLTRAWHGRVYINPPGGKVGNKSQAGLFWQKLMHERGHLDHAIFMAFSAEALQNTQRKDCPSIMQFPFCVPAKRIRFVSPLGEKSSPSHSNVVVYVPGNLDCSADFERVFGQFGDVVRPR